MKKLLHSAGGFIRRISIPTFAVSVLFIACTITAACMGQDIPTLISDILRRVGMNGLLVLAMVPSIKSGVGPNFALPIGIEGGLFALACCMQLDLSGWALIGCAIALAIVICSLMGYVYGKLMNCVRGAEMTIATYTGFSIVALFSILWLAVPFSNRKMGWMLGSGLRETIKLKSFGADAIVSELLEFDIGGVHIPTGILLLVLIGCLLVSLFFRTKTGLAIYAGGVNPRFSDASGLNNNKNRVIANIISTVIAGVGIIIYAQGYGYAQLYSAPMNMAFPAVAAILIGGATAARANVANVLAGTFVFQGLMTVAMPVSNALFTGTDLSDIMRQIIQNGVILYALTQVRKGGR